MKCYMLHVDGLIHVVYTSMSKVFLGMLTRMGSRPILLQHVPDMSCLCVSGCDQLCYLTRFNTGSCSTGDIYGSVL